MKNLVKGVPIDIKMVAGDSWPSLVLYIDRTDGKELEFTEADISSVLVRAKDRSSDTLSVDDAEADFSVEDDGHTLRIEYAWGSSDLEEGGVYDVEVEVVLPSNTRFTFPADSAIELTVRSRIS